MQTLNTKNRDFRKQWERYLEKAPTASENVIRVVTQIRTDVKRRGDEALFTYTRKFDRFTVTPATLRVNARELKQARKKIPVADYQVLKRAAGRIRAFHSRQQIKSWEMVKDGARMGLNWQPLNRVGLYVPGGQASYPSTVLMNAIPAQVAGVREIVMVSPSPAAYLNPYLLAAAELAGITEIYRVGGAQAIAALAYGTASIPAVDKIVGPGNTYVAEAKRQVFGTVAIDMIAGPTEVLIIADAVANPSTVAADLLSQAEHDADARAVLLSPSAKLITETLQSLKALLALAPRKKIAAASLKNHGLTIQVASDAEAIALANEMAPEHLELLVGDEQRYLKGIKNAGAIFLGEYSPVAAGDYAAGPNHVLPTARSARFASPLGVYDFMKATSWLKLSGRGLNNLAPDIVRLAEIEGLTAHGQSVTIRES